MKPLKIKIYLLLFSIACIGAEARAQNISASQGQGNFIQFNTYNELMAGAQSLGNVHIGISPSSAAISNWKLTVQVGAAISNGTTELHPQYISLRYNPQLASNQAIANAIQAPQVAVPLNLSEVTLINSAAYPLQAPPDYFFTLRYDIIIAGGQHLVNLQNGGYNCFLVFRLYDGQGVLRSTSSTNYNFNRYFFGEIPQNANGIEVQAGANEVSLRFNSAANYRDGVSSLLANGLKVTSAAGYQVKVKSSSANFSSANNTLLPVSAVKLESTAGNSAGNGIQYNTVNLSAAEQTIINKPFAGSTPVFYNLRYYTAPQDTRFAQAKTGIYEVTLTYTLQPL